MVTLVANCYTPFTLLYFTKGDFGHFHTPRHRSSMRAVGSNLLALLYAVIAVLNIACDDC